MLPAVIFGKTGLKVSRLALGGYPFGGVNRARGWDPFTPEGRRTAIATVHEALECGINYIDTAPGYGDGNSESIIGEALAGRRSNVVLATKVRYQGQTGADVKASVEESLRRLRVDMVDIVQFHGGRFEQTEIDHILNDGLLDALFALREKGRIRFIGFTVEEPWSGRPLLHSGKFDMVQVCYNFIYQNAALHVLNEARNASMGVAVMRPLTSGIMQFIARHIAPMWRESDIYETALKFVLADSRVQVINVGMRWPEEVRKNAEMVSSFRPSFDMADVPRMTVEVYKRDDEAGAGS
jgi:aryl-alcohol dehydrogenase-like predicted oxidoreductase